MVPSGGFRCLSVALFSAITRPTSKRLEKVAGIEGCNLQDRLGVIRCLEADTIRLQPFALHMR